MRLDALAAFLPQKLSQQGTFHQRLLRRRFRGIGAICGLWQVISSSFRSVLAT